MNYFKVSNFNDNNPKQGNIPKMKKNSKKTPKTSLNELIAFCFDFNCYVLPQPVGNDKIKLIAVDKGRKIESKKTYTHKEFKQKQIEFFNYFYNKYY